MEDSILIGTKKLLSMDQGYDAFDADVVIHINAALATLYQLGVGTAVLSIEDDSGLWSELGIPEDQLGMARSYVYLKVRMLFDPPATSFHLDVMKEQTKEFESRINMLAEGTTA